MIKISGITLEDYHKLNIKSFHKCMIGINASSIDSHERFRQMLMKANKTGARVGISFGEKNISNADGVFKYADIYLPDFIEIPMHGIPFTPPSEFVRRGKHIKHMIFTDFIIAPDMDPSWVLINIEKYCGLPNACFECNLMIGDVEDGWDYLKNEAPKFPDETQIEDLQINFEKHNRRIFLAVNKINKERINEILHAFPSLGGISIYKTLPGIKEDILTLHEIEQGIKIYQTVNC